MRSVHGLVDTWSLCQRPRKRVPRTALQALTCRMVARLSSRVVAGGMFIADWTARCTSVRHRWVQARCTCSLPTILAFQTGCPTPQTRGLLRNRLSSMPWSPQVVSTNCGAANVVQSFSIFSQAERLQDTGRSALLPNRGPHDRAADQHSEVAPIGLSSGAARVCFSTGPKLSLAPASVPLSIEDTEIQ